LVFVSFPYTTLFRSRLRVEHGDKGFMCDLTIEPEVHAGDGRDLKFLEIGERRIGKTDFFWQKAGDAVVRKREDECFRDFCAAIRSEEHTSELQSPYD